MWTHELIKTRALAILKTNYWEAFVISLVIGVVSGGFKVTYNENRTGFIFDIENGIRLSTGQIDKLLAFSSIAFGIFIVGLFLKIVLVYSIEVGGRKFFIQAAEGESKMGYIGYGFKKEWYLDIILTMLLRQIYLFLWMILLIIPGIIKTYAYTMVPYILADNPTIGYNRAIELSNQMTQGEKFDMFLLDLSFLGWYILGLFAFCIGGIFVMPYENATKAELYLVLRDKAIDSKLTSYEELNIEPNLDPEDS